MPSNKRSAFETFTEIVSWLQIVASALLISIVIGFMFYATNPSSTNQYIAISIVIMGLLIGIVWATRVWKKKSTINFMTTIMRTEEEKKGQDE